MGLRALRLLSAPPTSPRPSPAPPCAASFPRRPSAASPRCSPSAERTVPCAVSRACPQVLIASPLLPSSPPLSYPYKSPFLPILCELCISMEPAAMARLEPNRESGVALNPSCVNRLAVRVNQDQIRCDQEPAGCGTTTVSILPFSLLLSRTHSLSLSPPHTFSVTSILFHTHE
jgi:hypothetical protein